MDKPLNFPAAHMIRPARVRDGMGRELGAGDQVILTGSGVLLFDVVEVVPHLDPNAPPNMMRITLTAMRPFLCGADQPVREFLRVATAEELGRSQAGEGVGETPSPNGLVKPS